MATEPVAIRLHAGHDEPACVEMSGPLLEQLRHGYDRGASVMSLDVPFDDYLGRHRTARKRAARSRRLGYRVAYIDRTAHEDDVYDINTSMTVRQGRRMADAYWQPHRFSANPMRCAYHHVYPYGASFDGRLVAYLWLYRSGDLAMVSSILGHADHLANDVMYLLVTEAVRYQITLGGTMFYNLHTSGTDGLRYFKERLGFRRSDVAWMT